MSCFFSPIRFNIVYCVVPTCTILSLALLLWQISLLLIIYNNYFMIPEFNGKRHLNSFFLLNPFKSIMKLFILLYFFNFWEELSKQANVQIKKKGRKSSQTVVTELTKLYGQIQLDALWNLSFLRNFWVPPRNEKKKTKKQYSSLLCLVCCTSEINSMSSLTTHPNNSLVGALKLQITTLYLAL